MATASSFCRMPCETACVHAEILVRASREVRKNFKLSGGKIFPPRLRRSHPPLR